jgi:hypothetical protein
MHQPDPVITRNVKLRVAEFSARAAQDGLTTPAAIGARIGMHRITVWRLLNGEVEPGTNFIGAVLDTFDGAKFEDFFKVTRSVTVQEAA